MKRVCILSAAVLITGAVLPAQDKKKAPRPVPVPPAAPAASVSQVSAGPLDPIVKARIESFYTLLKEGRTEDSYRKLFEGSSIAKDRPELMTDLVEMTSKVMEKCGRIESTELLRVRPAGKCLREVTFIVNCQKRPLRWTFYAYFGEGRWQMLDTNVSLEPRTFFEEPAAPAGKE